MNLSIVLVIKRQDVRGTGECGGGDAHNPLFSWQFNARRIFRRFYSILTGDLFGVSS
jgi:hypothetical protein